jgi:hypothetical protein
MEEKRRVNSTAFGKHTVKSRRRKDPNGNKAFPRCVQKPSNKNDGASAYADSFEHFNSNFDLTALYASLYLAIYFELSFEIVITIVSKPTRRGKYKLLIPNQ